VPDTDILAKAQLEELDVAMKPKPGGKKVTVQFNPETLKVSYTNPVAAANGRRDESDKSAAQTPASGTAKLAVQLWLDVTAPVPSGVTPADDVRKLTQELIFFVLPRERGANDPPTSSPGVRFRWGSFQFDGIVDSLEESLEFFSSDGRPLRAGVSLGISQTQTQKVTILPTGASPGGGLPAGTSPLAIAQAGASLQQMAAAAGVGKDWQAIASANGIENPRILPPGQVINLRAR
jgi:hypothetical protein